MFQEWLDKLRELPDWVWRVAYVAGAVFAALVITAILRAGVRRVMRRRAGQNLRADTITKLLMSIIGYVVWFLAIIQVLQAGLGVDITSIIAAAGVLGVAVGFGAQTLVKDIISGFFILFENQYAVGEKVTIDGFNGTVKELGLRTTQIENENGDVFTIPNGSVIKVINHSRASGIS